MKKYKVKIPEGHEVDSTTTSSYPSITVYFRPIKKTPPKTWEEYLKGQDRRLPSIDEIRIPGQYEKEFWAFFKSIELRDVYNDGWVPDWMNKNQTKWCVTFDKEKISVIKMYTCRCVLSFRNEALSKQFVENFAEIITKAKPLL